MDKEYYKQLCKKSQVHLQEIQKELEGQGVIRRSRKVQNVSVLITAMLLFVTKNLSYRQLANEMAVRKVNRCIMSAVAWRKRLINFTAYFFKAVEKIFLSTATEEEKDAFSPTVQPKLLATDATDISIEGQKGYSMRLHVCYDIETKEVCNIVVSTYKQGETVRNFKDVFPSSIWIADRAYGHSNQLAYLKERGADYLVRVTPSHMTFYYDEKCHQKVDMSVLLHEVPFSRNVYCRYREEMTINGKKVTKIRICATRIVALKIPPDKYADAERRVHRRAKKKHQKVSESSLFYSHYLILATTLSEPKYPIDALAALYQRRWQIEILFKRSKGAFHFHNIRYASSDYYFLRVRLWAAIVIWASNLCSAMTALSPFSIFHIFSCLYT